ERRDARLKVRRDAAHERRNIDLLELRIAANPLEAVRHAIEALEIAAHMPRGGERCLVRCTLLEQLDPPAQARQRRPELVRGFTRHASPQPLARRVAARANDVEAREQ